MKATCEKRRRKSEKNVDEFFRVNPDRNIFSIKCGTDTYFINSMRFGPSSSPNLKL